MRRFLLFQAAVFLSAFLLFQVQPMLAKALLPGFGGSYLVWGACMAFYQVLLLLGYAAAHFVQRWLGVGRYARLHVVALLLALLLAPFDFEALSGEPGASNLALAVVLRLLAVGAAPFLVLSMASLLLQRWLSETAIPEAKNPYALYAASNLGSLLALLSYPVLVEPFLELRAQGWLWWAGYLVLVGLHAACLPPKAAANDKPEGLEPVAPRRAATWVALSASGTAVLIAVTNRLTFDVASAPFLWVAPLAVYLLTFVLAFKRVPWAPLALRGLFPGAIILAVMLHLLVQLRLAVPVLPFLVLQLGIVFVVCQRCHGLLAATRPQDPRQLTTFYLLLSLGGALGGTTVSWLAPVLTTSLAEVPLSLALAALAVSMAARLAGEEPASPFPSRSRVAIVLACSLGALALAMLGGGSAYAAAKDAPVALLLAPIALVAAFGLLAVRDSGWCTAAVVVAFQAMLAPTEALAIGADKVQRLRNYYGIYRVYDEDGVRWLQHGTTNHGRQHIEEPLSRLPLSYYHPSTPVSITLATPPIEARRLAMVGLGTGALASYLRVGQELVVLELDPDNFPIAEESFTYLRNARARGATITPVVGDGRLNLRREAEGSVDVLIIDAFSSGSVPAHLLTVEAMREYQRALRPDGFILMHISNKFLDLNPLAVSLARATGMHVVLADNDGNVAEGADLTWWAAFTASDETLEGLLALGPWEEPALDEDRLPRPWTDSFSNILGVLRLW